MLWNVAHRGGAGLARENRLEAFQGAIALGCRAFELDVHQCLDGRLLVIHDNDLKRCSGFPHQVSQHSLAQLQQLDPELPSLEQVLEVARGRCQVFLEIKEADPLMVYRCLKDSKMLEQVVVISFETQHLLQLQGKVRTGWLCGADPDFSQLRQGRSFDFLCPEFQLVDPELIEKTHSLGWSVNAWTVNEKSDLQALIEMGCDAITTDYPDRLAQLLA